MANTKSSTVWGLNEKGELVAVAGSGSADVKGNLYQDLIPVDDQGRLVINGPWASVANRPSGDAGGISNAVGAIQLPGRVPMPKWRVALAKMRNGQSNAKVAFMGSSTFLGLGNTTRATTFYPKLKKLLDDRFAPAFTGSTFGSGNLNLGATITFDPRITMGTGWQPNGNSSPVAGYYFMHLTTLASVMTFTPGEQFDTIEVLALRNNACGSFQISIDGGTTPLVDAYSGSTTAVPNASATDSLVWYKYSVPLQNGTVTIKSTVLGNGNRIHAVKCTNSAQKGIELWNWGISGALATNWTASPTVVYSGYQTMALHAPDLIFIGVGSNYWAYPNSRTLNDYKVDMQALVTRAKATGADVVLVGSHPTAATTGQNGVTYTATPVDLAVQRTFVDALAQMAIDNDCLYLDVFRRIGSYELMDSLGMAPAVPDGTHGGPYCHDDYAQAFYTALTGL